jgi:hypothetical protein
MYVAIVLIIHWLCGCFFRLISLKASQPVGEDDVNHMLLTIARYNFTSLALVTAVALFTLILFFVDGIISTGSFSTLLLALLILQIGFFVYEALRFNALRAIRSWPQHRVSAGSTAVYNEFAQFHETLREKIDRDGIDLKDDAEDTGLASESLTTSLFVKGE